MEGKMGVESLIPVLDVRDVDTSVSFYCDVLGFTLQDKVEWAGRTEWALLRTGKVQLMLCATQGDWDEDDHRINEGIFFLHLDNPEAVILEMGNRAQDRGIKPEAQLSSKDFYLRDPDGYILWFSLRPPVKETNVESEDGAQAGRESASLGRQSAVDSFGQNGHHSAGANGVGHRQGKAPPKSTIRL